MFLPQNPAALGPPHGPVPRAEKLFFWLNRTKARLWWKNQENASSKAPRIRNMTRCIFVQSFLSALASCGHPPPAGAPSLIATLGQYWVSRAGVGHCFQCASDWQLHQRLQRGWWAVGQSTIPPMLTMVCPLPHTPQLFWDSHPFFSLSQTVDVFGL